MAEQTIRVSVVCATPTRAFEREVELPAGATVGDAIERSRIASAAGLGPDDLRHVGIFGHGAEHRTVLRSGDRVEIYRPLKVDPKEARRLRAAKAGRRRDR